MKEAVLNEVKKSSTKNCQHEFAKKIIETDGSCNFINFTCKKCKHSFTKKILKNNIDYPELEYFKKYLDKPYQKSMDNEEIINFAVETINKYLAGDKQSRGLVLYGKRGTGKTHLAVKLVKNLKKHKKSIYAFNFSKFVYDRMKDINTSKFENIEQKTYSIEEEAMNADVLLIDEVGKGKVSDWVDGLLYSFVENAYTNENKFLIITTNLSIDELERKFDDAIISRLYEICNFISFNHLEDFRKA